MKFHLILAFSILLNGALAQEKPKFEVLQTKDGKEFKGVTVTSILPSEIRIMHESGAATVTFVNLPEAIKQQLGFDPKAAEAHRKEIAREELNSEVDRFRKEWIKENTLASVCTIRQVVSGGILIERGLVSDGSREKTTRTKRVAVGKATALDGKNPGTVYRTSTEDEWGTKTWTIPFSFVKCDTTNLVDGGSWSGSIISTEPYSYSTVLGASKTVPGYTSDIAAKLLEALQARWPSEEFKQSPR